MAASELSRLGATLVLVAEHLGELGAEWALVGGLAVSARAEPRFTRDVDLVVSVSSDREAEGIVHALVGRGYRLLLSLEQAAVGRLATVRLAVPIEGETLVVVDLLFASSGIEPEVVRGATRIEIVAGLEAPVARLGHLLALKVLARDDVRRPQDLADLRALLREADDEEIQIARDALREIVERGFHRGRDVVGALEEHLRR